MKVSDLRKVSGIGDKTIRQIKDTLLQKNIKVNRGSVTYEDSFTLPLNNFYVGESVKWMQDNIPCGFVDLTVTSPPYDNLRDYKCFEFNYKAMLEELYRVTKDDGVVVWIVSDATVNGSETGTSFKQALYAKEVGFNLHDTMIYAKNNPMPNNANRYTPSFEYMFVLSKGKPKTFNPIMENCIHAGKKASRTIINADGSRDHQSLKGEYNKTKKKSNIFYYTVGTLRGSDYKHPAKFPEELAQDHILSWSNKGDIVFDPMCGSGTTCKMAYLNGRKFIGVDVSEEYINDICIPRLREYGWTTKK